MREVVLGLQLDEEEQQLHREEHPEERDEILVEKDPEVEGLHLAEEMEESLCLLSLGDLGSW